MSVIDMCLDGALASAFATVISNPFDVVRTRMQLQGAMCREGEYQVAYRNMFHAMGRIASEEGMRSLQRGLGVAVLWQTTQNGIRLGLYPMVKGRLEHLYQGQSTAICVLAGAACGVVGCVTASPFMLVKVRSQSQNRALTGQHVPTNVYGVQYQYRGTWDALRQIFSEHGVRGLWQGAGVAAQRTMLGSATQLTTYDLAKEYACQHTGLLASDVRVHIFAACVAASFIVLLMNPVDVFLTRAYNQRAEDARCSSNNLVRSIWRIYKVEGVKGLYKGSVALYSRMAPHNIATFVALEWLRSMRERYTNRSYTSGSILKRYGSEEAAVEATLDS